MWRSIWLVLLMAALATACTSTTTVNGVPVPTPTPATGQSTEAEAHKRAEIRLELAAGYYRRGQFAVALDETRRSLDAEPGYALAHSMLGLIYLELGDRRQAETSFADALRLDPQNPEVLNNHGWFLCQTGRERESIDFFQRAAANRLYRTPGLAMQNAGLCMLRVKDVAAAETFLRRSFELDAMNPVTKFQLARLYLSKREIDRASFYYGLIDKSGGQPAPLLWLGLRIARAKGDVRSERRLAEELRQSFPDSPEAGALARRAYDE